MEIKLSQATTFQILEQILKLSGIKKPLTKVSKGYGCKGGGEKSDLHKVSLFHSFI